MSTKDKNIVLVIGAHPDDIEFACGATVAKFAQSGDEVYGAISTEGNRGSRHHEIESSELIKTRKAEQEEAAQIIGIKEMFFLGEEDGNLQADLKFKEKVVKLIRKLKPNIVITHDPSWFYKVRADGKGSVNHNDHRETGKAVLDAVYPLSRDLASFPEHSAEGLTPHTVKELWLFNFDEATYIVDVSETIDKKVEGILAHKSQIDDPEKTTNWVKDRASKLGEKNGFRFAEGYIKLVFD